MRPSHVGIETKPLVNSKNHLMLRCGDRRVSAPSITVTAKELSNLSSSLRWQPYFCSPLRLPPLTTTTLPFALMHVHSQEFVECGKSFRILFRRREKPYHVLNVLTVRYMCCLFIKLPAASVRLCRHFYPP